MKILMVLTSHDKLGNTGRKTGFWLEELAAPYFVFKDAGAEIVLASPKGGQPPLDPKSNEPSFQTDLTHRFEADAAAKAQLASTVRLDTVKQEDYDTVFCPGSHGPMWDLVEDKNSIMLLESFLAAGKTFAVVCHSSGALRHVKTPGGKLFVEGKTVTGFTNGEEEEVGLTKVVPFLVEDELMSLGATFSKVKNWGVHTVADGQLITGQNPASSGPAAKVLLEMLKQAGLLAARSVGQAQGPIPPLVAPARVPGRHRQVLAGWLEGSAGVPPRARQRPLRPAEKPGSPRMEASRARCVVQSRAQL
jgi:putative intracellular protease/amidase